MGKVDKDEIEKEGGGGGKLTKKGKVKVFTNPISLQRYHFNFTKFQSRILNFFPFSQKAKSSKLKGIEFSFFKNNFLTYVQQFKILFLLFLSPTRLSYIICYMFPQIHDSLQLSTCWIMVYATCFLRFMIPCSCILVSFLPNCNKGHQKTNLKAEDFI